MKQKNYRVSTGYFITVVLQSSTFFILHFRRWTEVDNKSTLKPVKQSSKYQLLKASKHTSMSLKFDTDRKHSNLLQQVSWYLIYQTMETIDSYNCLQKSLVKFST